MGHEWWRTAALRQGWNLSIWQRLVASGKDLLEPRGNIRVSWNYDFCLQNQVADVLIMASAFASCMTLGKPLKLCLHSLTYKYRDDGQ